MRVSGVRDIRGLIWWL